MADAPGSSIDRIASRLSWQGFGHYLSGCTPEQVRRVREAQGPLPAVIEEFLLKLGHGVPGVGVGSDSFSTRFPEEKAR